MLSFDGKDEEDDGGEPVGTRVETPDADRKLSDFAGLLGRTVVLGIDGIVGWPDPAPATELRAATEVDRGVLTDEVEEGLCRETVGVAAMLGFGEVCAAVTAKLVSVRKQIVVVSVR